MVETGNYYSAIYQGYKYIWQSKEEILKKQLLLDPAQDTVIEKGFLIAIQSGHSHNELTAGKNEIHDLLHLVPLPFGLNTHSFGVEFILHSGIKLGATLAFPIAFPFINSTISPELKDTALEPLKFFGINPLEGLHSLKSLIPANTTLSNKLDNISYSENYHQMRADDDNFKQFMTAYDNWMESIDAIMHARGELSILSNNWHLSSMPLKASLYLQTRMYLYETTKAEEEANEQRIETIRLPHNNETCTDQSHIHHIQEEASTSWTDMIYSGANWAYENKGYLTYNSVKALNQAYTIYKAYKMILPMLEFFYPHIGGEAHMRMQNAAGVNNPGNVLALLNNPTEVAKQVAIGEVKSKVTSTILEAVEKLSSINPSDDSQSAQGLLSRNPSSESLQATEGSLSRDSSCESLVALENDIDNDNSEISELFNNKASASPAHDVVRAISTPLEGNEDGLPVGNPGPSGSPARPLNSPSFMEVIEQKHKPPHLPPLPEEDTSTGSSLDEVINVPPKRSKVLSDFTKMVYCSVAKIAENPNWNHAHSDNCGHNLAFSGKDDLGSEWDD